MNDDNLDKIITGKLEECVNNISISSELKDAIKLNTIKKSLSPLERLKKVLNYTIEIPVIPFCAAVCIVLLLLFIPFNISHKYNNISIPNQYTSISIDGSTIIVESNQRRMN